MNANIVDVVVDTEWMKTVYECFEVGYYAYEMNTTEDFLAQLR